MQTFSWKRFGYWLIAFLLIYQAVSYAVDPLGLNFRFTHPGLNAIKPAAVGFERKLKPLRIKKVQPQTLILGSSRAAYGIDPDRLHGFPYPIFNAAVEYGQLYEMYRMLEYAVEIAPIKEVVLLLHYYNFNQSSGIRDFAPIFSRGEMRPLVEAHTLAYFSSDAAWGIFKTCFANLAMNHKKGSTERDTSSTTVKNNIPTTMHKPDVTWCLQKPMWFWTIRRDSKLSGKYARYATGIESNSTRSWGHFHRNRSNCAKNWAPGRQLRPGKRHWTKKSPIPIITRTVPHSMPKTFTTAFTFLLKPAFRW